MHAPEPSPSSFLHETCMKEALHTCFSIILLASHPVKLLACLMSRLSIWGILLACLLAFMVKSLSQCSYFLISLSGFEFFFLLFGAMVGSRSLGHLWQLDQDPVFTTSLLFGFLLQKNGFTAYMVTLAVYYLVWKWVLSLSLSPSCLACMFVAMYQTKHKIYTRRSSCASIHALYMCHRIFCCNGNIEDSERKKMLKHKHHLKHSCYLQLFSCCKMLDFLAYKWWSECLWDIGVEKRKMMTAKHEHHLTHSHYLHLFWLQNVVGFLSL